MEIMVTDRDSIERGVTVKAGTYAVISIRDPDKPNVTIPRTSGLRAVLELAFHDTDPTAGFLGDARLVHMTNEQAREIARFVIAHLERVKAIVCHCEQGASRSPAIAAAIAKQLGEDDAHFWMEYVPNKYVYDLTTQAFTALSKDTSKESNQSM